MSVAKIFVVFKKFNVKSPSDYIRTETEPNAVVKNDAERKKDDDSIAFIKEYSGSLDKGLSMIFHGALGPLNRFDHLANWLIEKGEGKVIGIGIKDVKNIIP